MGSDQWSRESEASLLSTTTVNGFIVCLRELSRTDTQQNLDIYTEKFKGVDTFDFKSYKSSHWRALGLKLHATYFM